MKLKGILIGIGIPIAIGLLAAFFTRGNMQLLNQLNQPPLTPAGWIFPVVWTILYILMGIASYRVYLHGENDSAAAFALTIYGVQLILNFFWSIVFFNLHWYLFAFIWLLILWAMVLFMNVRFYKIDIPAGLMILPYSIWVTFAAYLNIGIYILNR